MINNSINRKFWLDSVKVFGITLVVFGHFTPDYKNDFLCQLIYSFHMPLFFIISGYLCSTAKNDFIEYLK